MQICYVDEAGNPDKYVPLDSGSSPVFVLVGVSVPVHSLKTLTMDFVHLKTKYEPRLANEQLSEAIRLEIKGSGLRRDVRENGHRNRRRRAFNILDETLDLLEKHKCRLMGKVHVKVEAKETRPTSVYTRAVAELAETFDQQMRSLSSKGLLILDAQTKFKNTANIHTITTRRFRKGGDAFPCLVEAPVLGHSDTHVPLQLADIVASALIYPMACAAYFGPAKSDPHRDSSYSLIRTRFGKRLLDLEYRYDDVSRVRRGGFMVIDPLAHRPTHLLFRD